MTEKQFFAKLKKTPRDWRVYNNRIRRSGMDGSECPITALAGMTLMEVTRACFQLEIAREMRDKIIEAADGECMHSKDLRAKLLKACGLS